MCQMDTESNSTSKGLNIQTLKSDYLPHVQDIPLQGDLGLYFVWWMLYILITFHPMGQSGTVCQRGNFKCFFHLQGTFI